MTDRLFPRLDSVVLVVDLVGCQGKQHAFKAMAVDGTNARCLRARERRLPRQQAALSLRPRV